MDKQKVIGITCAIIAACIFGFSPILVKLAYIEGSNTITLIFLRGLLSFPILLFILRQKNVSVRAPLKDFGIMVLLGFLVTCVAGAMLYSSYHFISVGLANCMNNIYPVAVVLGSVLIFKDKVSRTQVLALVLVLGGLATILENDGSIHLYGILLAIGSGIVYATYLLILDKCGMSKYSPFLIAFYSSCTVAVVIFIFGLATDQFVYDLTLKAWMYILILAILMSVVATSLVPVAVKNAGVTVTSLLGILDPITAIIAGILFLGENITAKSLIGCGLVITAAVILSLEKAPISEKIKG